MSLFKKMQSDVKLSMDYTHQVLSQFDAPANLALEKLNSHYPLFNFKLVKSTNPSTKPFYLSITKQRSEEEKPHDIFTGFVGNFNQGKAQIECLGELENVSLVLHQDGTLAINELADGLNYRFQSAGVITTSETRLVAKQASIELVCGQFNLIMLTVISRLNA